MGKIKTFLAALVLCAVPAILYSTASAAGNFGLENITVLDKATDVVAETPTVSGNTATSTIIFHQLDDYVVYNLSLKNSTSTSFQILDITDDNASELVEYSYDNHADEVVESGEALNLEVIITYVQEHLDDSDRTIDNNVKFTISYLDLLTGEVEESEVVLVPNTGTNTFLGGIFSSATNIVIVAVLILASIALAVAFIYKKKRAVIILAFAIVFTTAGFSYMNAVAEDYKDTSVTLDSEIRLRDYIYGEVYYRDPSTGEDAYMDPEEFAYEFGPIIYADCLEYEYYYCRYFGDIFDPGVWIAPDRLVVTGFKFTGTDTDVDPGAPILDDFSVTLIYDEPSYDINYDYAGGTVAVANPATIKNSDEPFTLNRPTKEGAYFKCWRGTDIYRCVEDVTVEPEYVYGDLSFTAYYKHEVIVNDQNGVEIDRRFVDEGSEGYYESIDFHTDEFKITGGSCTNGQRIIVTDNSYEIKDITSNTTCTIQTAPVTYEVSLVVNRGSGSGSMVVEKGSDATFNNIVADELYELSTGVSCTNGQTATISNGIVVVNGVTDNTVCTVNAIPPSLHTITYMQQMTPEICAATTTPRASLDTAGNDDWDGSHYGDQNYIPRKALIDTRDQQKYLVAKLADGECWMTQNLNLEMSTEKTLTKADTDLQTKDSYTPDRNTLPSTPIGGTPYGDLATVSNMQLSWHTNTKYYVGNEQYPDIGIVKSDAPTSDADEYLWQNAGILYTGMVLSTGDYHYGDGGGVYYSNTICPKGWTLPDGKGKENYYESEPRLKSFDKLYITYRPSREPVDYMTFNQTSIFKLVYPGYYQSHEKGVLWYETQGAYFTSNYIAEYNGQSNRISTTKAFWYTTNSFVNSSIAAFAASGLSARCVAR